MNHALRRSQVASIAEAHGIPFVFTISDGTEKRFTAPVRDLDPQDVRYGQLAEETGDALSVIAAARSSLAAADYTPARGDQGVDPDGVRYRVVHIQPARSGTGLLELTCAVSG